MGRQGTAGGTTTEEQEPAWPRLAEGGPLEKGRDGPAPASHWREHVSRAGWPGRCGTRQLGARKSRSSELFLGSPGFSPGAQGQRAGSRPANQSCGAAPQARQVAEASWTRLAVTQGAVGSQSGHGTANSRFLIPAARVLLMVPEPSRTALGLSPEASWARQ